MGLHGGAHGKPMGSPREARGARRLRVLLPLVLDREGDAHSDLSLDSAAEVLHAAFVAEPALRRAVHEHILHEGVRRSFLFTGQRADVHEQIFENNIAEISAKGEAQIAVVDLVGMTCGILLSRAIGTSRMSIGAAFLALSFVDLFAIYQEIRAVVFKDLNYERLSIVLEHFMASNPPLSASASSYFPT